MPATASEQATASSATTFVSAAAAAFSVDTSTEVDTVAPLKFADNTHSGSKPTLHQRRRSQTPSHDNTAVVSPGEYSAEERNLVPILKYSDGNKSATATAATAATSSTLNGTHKMQDKLIGNSTPSTTAGTASVEGSLMQLKFSPDAPAEFLRRHKLQPPTPYPRLVPPHTPSTEAGTDVENDVNNDEEIEDDDIPADDVDGVDDVEQQQQQDNDADVSEIEQGDYFSKAIAIEA